MVEFFLEHSRFYGECNLIIFRDLVQQVFVFETTFNNFPTQNLSDLKERNKCYNFCIKCRHRANGPFLIYVFTKSIANNAFKKKIQKFVLGVNVKLNLQLKNFLILKTNVQFVCSIKLTQSSPLVYT
jgi:hypothetical protein